MAGEQKNPPLDDETLDAIDEAEAEIEQGETVDAREALAQLRRDYLGSPNESMGGAPAVNPEGLIDSPNGFNVRHVKLLRLAKTEKNVGGREDN